ncbi:hypothetical protein Tco_0150864 [Tanacetum coccineum]
MILALPFCLGTCLDHLNRRNKSWGVVGLPTWQSYSWESLVEEGGEGTSGVTRGKREVLGEGGDGGSKEGKLVMERKGVEQAKVWRDWTTFGP